MDLPLLSPLLGDHIALVEKRRRLPRFHRLEIEIMEIPASWRERVDREFGALLGSGSASSGAEVRASAEYGRDTRRGW